MLAAALPSDLSASHALLHVLLEVSLPGIILFRPVYATDDPTSVLDLAYVHLNPAAQQMLHLPAQPPETFRTLYPNSLETGIFAFYRDTFLSGQPGEYAVNYQYDGLDNFFLLTARRCGELLVVGFTDTAAQERSQVEQALRESQAREQAARAEAEVQRRRFYEVLMALPAHVAVHEGADQTFIFVNAAYQRLFPTHSFAGRPIREVLPELSEQGILDVLDHVYRTGEPYYGTEVPLTVDFTGTGERNDIYLNAFFQPLRNGQGEVYGVLDFSYDVTDSVLARQQVELLNQELEARVQARTREVEAARATTERQRRQWEELFRTAPAGICIFDGPEWVYQFVNPGYQALFPGRALMGKRLVEALPEVADQPLMAILHRVYDTGEPFQANEVLVPLARHEGGPVEDIYFDLTYLARYNEQGQIDGFITYAYDATERVRARRQLEQVNQQLVAQQAELRRLFAQAPMAIVVLRGPQFIIEQANEQAERVWGRTAAEVLGRPHFEALADSAGQGMEELLTGVLQTGEPVVLHEVPINLERTHTGQPNMGYYSIIFKPLRDVQQQVDGIAVMWTEQTDQVLARQQVLDLNQELAVINEELTATNEELNKSNSQLTRTNVELDTFIYTASHDLKAPITNIEAILLALRAQLPAAVQQDELVAQLLDMLQGTVARFQLTITQLTDIAKLQLAHAGLAEPVQLAQVVEDVRQDLLPLLEQAATQLTVEVAPELVVSFSPANLRSVVYNLLSNASKYRSPARPSRVRVHAAQTPQVVVLTVQDNGLGMSEVQQRQLFGLFQRLHTHVEGTGVGLYIVKRLVENGGGTITVQSQPDAGSTFVVTIPYPNA